MGTGQMLRPPLRHRSHSLRGHRVLRPTAADFTPHQHQPGRFDALVFAEKAHMHLGGRREPGQTLQLTKVRPRVA